MNTLYTPSNETAVLSTLIESIERLSVTLTHLIVVDPKELPHHLDYLEEMNLAINIFHGNVRKLVPNIETVFQDKLAKVESKLPLMLSVLLACATSD